MPPQSPNGRTVRATGRVHQENKCEAIVVVPAQAPIIGVIIIRLRGFIPDKKSLLKKSSTGFSVILTNVRFFHDSSLMVLDFLFLSSRLLIFFKLPSSIHYQ